jgi:hypothetical protein
MADARIPVALKTEVFFTFLCFFSAFTRTPRLLAFGFFGCFVCGERDVSDNFLRLRRFALLCI